MAKILSAKGQRVTKLVLRQAERIHFLENAIRSAIEDIEEVDDRPLAIDEIAQDLREAVKRRPTKAYVGLVTELHARLTSYQLAMREAVRLLSALPRQGISLTVLLDYKATASVVVAALEETMKG